MSTTAIERVVLRAPNWIGDAVMALGGLREVRRITAGAHLAVAARPWIAGILDEARIADEVIVLEQRGWRDVVDVGSRLRAGRFDLAVLFQNAFGAALGARLARIPRIAGYPTDGRGLLLTDRLSIPENHSAEHQSRYYMAIARGLELALTRRSDIDVARPDLSLTASPAARRRAVELLGECGIVPGTPLAVLNPGATNSRAKQWPPERFAAAGDTLSARFGMRVVVVGSAGDREVAERVAELSASRPAVLAGRTDVRELVGLLANAAVLVSNDTGPAHLGAALGVPTVTIFGPTEQFATRPVGPAAVVASHPVECAPCMLRDCPIDHRCMTRLEPEDVIASAQQALGLAARTK